MGYYGRALSFTFISWFLFPMQGYSYFISGVSSFLSLSFTPPSQTITLPFQSNPMAFKGGKEVVKRNLVGEG